MSSMIAFEVCHDKWTGGMKCFGFQLMEKSRLADDAYQEVEDELQVDVEELMVMEAIRLSLLDSHQTRGLPLPSALQRHPVCCATLSEGLARSAGIATRVSAVAPRTCRTPLTILRAENRGGREDRFSDGFRLYSSHHPFYRLSLSLVSEPLAMF